MELELKLTVSISTDDGLPDPQRGSPQELKMRASALQAIRNALQQVEDMGFSHAMADETSVSVLEVSESTPIIEG